VGGPSVPSFLPPSLLSTLSLFPYTVFTESHYPFHCDNCVYFDYVQRSCSTVVFAAYCTLQIVRLTLNDSRYYFNFQLPSEPLMKRKDKFIEKFMASQSLLDYFAIQ